jgi:hypothetical protein
MITIRSSSAPIGLWPLLIDHPISEIYLGHKVEFGLLHDASQEPGITFDKSSREPNKSEAIKK